MLHFQVYFNILNLTLNLQFATWIYVNTLTLFTNRTVLFQVKRVKVSFKSSHVIHDYPSEEIAKVVFDELQNNNNVPLKTLQNYQPAGLVNMEKKLGCTGENPQVQVTQSVSNGEKRVHDISNGENHTEIKYADEGQGFTDATDSASALLF